MIAEVIVDVATSELDKIFDYKTNAFNVSVGSRVVVPFGKYVTEGFVMRLKENSSYPVEKLKGILRVVDDIPALTSENLKLCDYMHDLYHVPYAPILRLFLPTEMRKGTVRKKTVDYVEFNKNLDYNKVISSFSKNSKAKFRLCEYLYEKGKTKRSALTEIASSSVIKNLIDDNVLTVIEEREIRTPYKDIKFQDNKHVLTYEQQNAVNVVLNADRPVLIHGVTGSGKTEVYLNLIENAVKNGKTAIMLVPEIALTPQMFSRLKARFGDLSAILHSGLSKGEKFDEWWRLRSGEAKIAIGARSAIFAPLENIGLIIIDEEHDSSYESETSPRYVTSDIALYRAKLNGAQVVLGSATPKFESYNNAIDKKYILCEMNLRVNGKPMPEIVISDMKDEARRGNPSMFSSVLKEEINKALVSDNQVIIFLNRRGFSQKIICRECGYVAKCTHCDVSLTYHRFDNLLKCHYCGSTYHTPKACPDCGSVKINYSGTGTQKVVEELQNMFPTSKILRMDNDTTSTKEGHYKILNDFASKKANILVGTQMIAKGHDFPSVTLVGIIDADMSLYFSDYRSGERTFQLITQVAGRSGRAGSKGKVVLQTYSPENSILNYAIRYDYKGFFKKEKALRLSTSFPPYADIVRIMIESDDDALALDTLKNVYFECKQVYEKYNSSFVYFNKMRSPLKRIKNKFRYQILARITDNRKEIEDIFYTISNKHSKRNALCYVEINPTNLS